MARPRNPDTITRAERNRISRAKRAGSVTLTTDAAAALERLRRPDETKATAVERVLLASTSPDL